MSGLKKFVLIVSLSTALMSVDADPASADCNWDRYAKIDHWDLELIDVSVDGESQDDDLAQGAFDVALRSFDTHHRFIVEDADSDNSFEAVFRSYSIDDIPQDFETHLADHGDEQ